MALTEKELQDESKYLKKVYQLIEQEALACRGALKNKYASIVSTNKDFSEDVPLLNGGADFDQIVEIYKYNDIVESEERHYNDINARLRVLNQMLNSAYFGKIDFLEDGESYSDKYYVGVSSLKDEDDDFLILDWRAPICSLYYQYDAGKCSYECPAGVVSGDLLSKRQFGIKNDNILYAFDTDVVIEDQLLCRLLSESRDKKMGHIVKSIQKEQNEAIRKSSSQHLVVFGPAGSGKTSVAMHRAAYLLYKHRDTIKSQNMLILSPNSIFMDYISEVLPDLGEANARINTINQLFAPLLTDFRVETHNELMEKILDTEKDNSKRIKQAKFKNSAVFLEILKRYAKFVDQNDFKPHDIEFNGRMLITAEEVSRLYYHDWLHMNYSQRLKRIAAKIYAELDVMIEARKKEIAAENADTFTWEIDEISEQIINNEFASIRSKIDHMFGVNTVALYANMFKSKKFYDTLSDITDISFEEFRDMVNPSEYYNLHKLNREDFFPLLFVRCIIDGQKPPIEDTIRFIFLDEFQDIPPTGIYVLQKIFSKAAITLVGDINQTIDCTAQLYDENIVSMCLDKPADIFKLKKSYRSTSEITSFANKLIFDDTVEYMDRHGAPVNTKNIPDPAERAEDILNEVSIATSEGFHSIGLICKDAASAEDLHTYLKTRHNATVSLVLDDNDSYSSGVVVMPSYLSKGLEFDAVMVTDAEKYNLSQDLRLYYTACTRAMHKLIIYGEPIK